MNTPFSKKRVFVITLGCAAILLGAATRGARAAIPVTCDFTRQFSELAEIEKNPNSDYLTQLRAELNLRKGILKGVIACALNDVQSLHTGLESIASSDADVRQIRDHLLGNLEQVTGYYETQLARVDDLGLYGTKEFSKSLSDWRAGSGAAVLEETTNFLIWNKNQELLSIAQQRLQDVSRTVNALKLGDNEDIKKLFGEAGSSFRDAQAANNNAKQLFKNNAGAAESLAAVKSSLSALARTYQSFFDLSDAVHKFIPQ